MNKNKFSLVTSFKNVNASFFSIEFEIKFTLEKKKNIILDILKIIVTNVKVHIRKIILKFI